MRIRKPLLVATIAFGLSLNVSAQPKEENPPPIGGPGAVLSEEEIAELLTEPRLLREAERWRSNGYPDIPVEVLPVEVREALGLTAGTIPPEVFYGPRMQQALEKHLGPVAWDGSAETIIDASHPSVTERERQEIRQVAEREFGPNAVVVTSPEILRAFEEHAGDEAALRTAIEAAIPSLSAEMQQSLQAGFHIQMEDVDLPLRKDGGGMTPERLPTEEVLARISPESQTALAAHRDLLDDHWELIRSLPNLPAETRRAAEEFLGRLQEPVPAAPRNVAISRNAGRRWQRSCSPPSSKADFWTATWLRAPRRDLRASATDFQRTGNNRSIGTWTTTWRCILICQPCRPHMSQQDRGTSLSPRSVARRKSIPNRRSARACTCRSSTRQTSLRTFRT